MGTLLCVSFVIAVFTCFFETATSYVPTAGLTTAGGTTRYRDSFRLASFNRGYTQPESKRGAYEIAKNELSVKMPVIILVSPFLDANVGSVCRSMLNFGMSELRLVNPQCDHLSDASRALASGAYEILENAKVFLRIVLSKGVLRPIFY